MAPKKPIVLRLTESPLDSRVPIFLSCTDEGRALNEAAREFGDEPEHWFISEVPVDVLAATDVLIKSRFKPRLEPAPWYLKDVRRMVAMCRKAKVYIPPSWMSIEEATKLAETLGVPEDPGSITQKKELGMF